MHYERDLRGGATGAKLKPAPKCPPTVCQDREREREKITQLALRLRHAHLAGCA